MRALATSVQVAEVTLKDAPLFVKAQGTVEASRSVAIQAQVTGIIKKIGFTPGQTVKAGQLLFKIDSTTYEAALAKAEANLSKDEAQLQMTQKDSSRYQTLIKKGFISKQQYDQTQAQLNENLSTVKLDKAAIQQNQAKLNYTTILAPISGKTGNVTIKEGDLVNASSDKPLVTVNQLSPIYVDFYLPQADLDTLLKYEKLGTLTVEVYDGGHKKLLDTGKLTFINNTVDANTGTVLLKGSFPNKQGFLWPGESVIVKLIFTVEKNQLAIPSRAVQSDQQGNFVYLIKSNHTIITPVQVLRQLKQTTFIRKGLQPGDQVATVFPPDLENNALVSIIKSNATNTMPVKP
ncbi:efflux RND transporter periplasmic adaptor subunit [Candidiatus Paracoxiella cheracis]|uniref:efflux RND transporter periplasmic adaptor subunit n=1 Tax=Candidiatus Paracoxiella cheracis TaxID=3405120 RepID=UPI003BF610AB